MAAFAQGANHSSYAARYTANSLRPSHTLQNTMLLFITCHRSDRTGLSVKQ